MPVRHNWNDNQELEVSKASSRDADCEQCEQLRQCARASLSKSPTHQRSHLPDSAEVVAPAQLHSIHDVPIAGTPSLLPILVVVEHALACLWVEMQAQNVMKSLASTCLPSAPTRNHVKNAVLDECPLLANMCGPSEMQFNIFPTFRIIFARVSAVCYS